MYEGRPRNTYAQVQSVRLYIWSPTVLGIRLLHLSDLTHVGSWGGLLLPWTWKWRLVGAECWFMQLFEWKHSLQRWVIVGVIVRIKYELESNLTLTITPTITHLWNECFHSNNHTIRHPAPSTHSCAVNRNNNPAHEPAQVQQVRPTRTHMEH